MNKEEILGAFSLVNNPIVLSEEEVKDVQKAIKQLQQENQELKKQYCERTDCSGRLGNSKKVDQLEKELEQLKEINEEHKKLNGELREENKKYKEVIDKAIEYINYNLTISSILDGKKYYTINNYSFDYKELLDILKEVE